MHFGGGGSAIGAISVTVLVILSVPPILFGVSFMPLFTLASRMF